MANTPAFLRVRGLSKRFGATIALGGVDFDLRRGTVHALLGGNGSGKSTFIKALAGVQKADSGTICIGSREFDAHSMTPAQVRSAGLHFVHQQLAGFPQLSVAENLLLAQESSGFRRISWPALYREAQALLDRFNIDASPRSPMEALNPASQVMVVIARVLGRDDPGSCSTVVLDEPTASLPAAEADALLASLRRLSAQGQSIVYVTHRLGEVMQIADEATVFRDGRVAARLSRSEMSHARLVESIMGRQVEAALERTGHHANSRKEPVAVVSGLSGGPLREVNLSVYPGEICGVAGLVGSGRSTLLRAIFGAKSMSTGTVELRGRSIEVRSPRDAMGAGIALVPEDRTAEAAFPGMTVRENLGICTTSSYFHGFRLRHRDERRDANALLTDYHVKAPSQDLPFTTLSGGNQQKIVLARWLRRSPDLILLDEPTQGIDVGARAEIWELVRRATDKGACALVVSSDFEELARVCDRVLVMRSGRLFEELSGDDLNEERVTQLALSEER